MAERTTHGSVSDPGRAIYGRQKKEPMATFVGRQADSSDGGDGAIVSVYVPNPGYRSRARRRGPKRQLRRLHRRASTRLSFKEWCRRKGHELPGRRP